ncbi:hypothetical protein SAMN05216358_0051 [Rhizobium sp. AN5]|nr:hypothetical protein SAMN05216358_0051 [Rhizobium sp. AN5]
MESNQGKNGVRVHGLPWVGVGGDGLPRWSVENRGAATYLLWTLTDFLPYTHTFLSTHAPSL